MQNSAAVIDEAIRSLREISNNLSPHILSNFGLARGIKQFVDRLGTTRDTNILFTTTIGEERFDSNIEVILYRVVCELVNNSLKHAKCTDISITLRRDGKYLVVNRGMGLSNIRSRISSLNGKIKITSRPNEGMLARVSVATDGSMEGLADVDIEELNEVKKNGKRRRKNSSR